ncbi:TFIIA-alpha and beta-like factor isoform X2 [Heteronotia binoei]|uniref:TFIIA-alpha and beta-like factor isoform X2 n=1 Tax=Heteronotia binoei TaxID=13085 RepID=UPI002931398F|nr:TFIIA-alpha and beta-like factor isoform X2 [Heteronotia binoei]
MAHGNPVRWETKVMQSKATEGFFRHSHLSPQFTLHLPQNFPQALQTSAGVAAGRGIRQVTTTTTTTTAELASSRAGGAILTLPSGLSYPIQIPAGVTLQTASGQLYKVNMPMVVTQAPGGGTVLQNPVQQILQQLGQQPSQPQTTAADASQVNTLSVQVSGNESLQVQKPIAPQQIGPEENTLPSSAVLQDATEHQEEVMGNGMSQEPSSFLETPQNIDLQAAVPVSKSSEADSAGVAAEMAPSDYSKEGEMPMNPDRPLDADDIIELIIMGNELDDSVLLRDEATLSFAEELNSSIQLESSLRTQKDITSDLEEIIQLDGTSDVSPKTELESPRDGEDEEIIGIVDAEELKVLDEEEEEEVENSTSDNPSLSSTSDTDERSVDIIEEDPLNSGDDVSEQETPDVFDTDNIILCQYDKVQRSKNRWKFYLKDGVMCFGGKDYVFSKAIGDAEW